MSRGVRAVAALVAVFSLVACARPATPSTSPVGAPATSAVATAIETPTPTPSQTPTPDPVSVTVVMNGDLLWHDTVWQSAEADARSAGAKAQFDFKPMFAELAPIIGGASMAICQSEVPFAPEGGPYLNYPLFAAPPAAARAMADLGYDLCTQSSNHSLDQWFDGLVWSTKVWDSVGVLHVGTYATQAASKKPVIFTTKEGVKIGVVDGAYGTNGIPLPDDAPWAVDNLDIPGLLARAKATRAAGADIVMVAMHGGEEYVNEPNAQQVEVATALAASPDVDIIYGHHVHVVQPWTRINGKLVIYGLGNTVAQHLTSVPEGYEGVTARITFTGVPGGKFTVRKAEYIPTLWNFYQPGIAPIRIQHVVADIAAGTAPDLQRLRLTEQRTREIVTSMGITGVVES